MARLPALIAALARTDGRDAKALAWLARNAREGGLITTTKRGVGAAEMTAGDAANLLIAANLAEVSRDGLPLVVEMIRSFVPTGAIPSAEERAEPSVFGDISRAETFGDALEQAIDGAAELALRLLLHVRKRFADEPNAALRKHAFGMDFVGFNVEFETRGGAPIAATLRLWQREGTTRHDEQVWQFLGDTALIESGYYARQADFDRRGSVTVGLKTLAHLWAALHAPDADTAETLAELGIVLEGTGA